MPQKTAPKKKKKETKIRSLVTGACGFIGSHMVETLAAAGHEVIATDFQQAWQEDSYEKALFPGLVKKLAKETFVADLTDPASLAKLPTNVDYVFHVASLFNYTATLATMRKVNVDGTRALASRYLGKKRLKRWVQWGAGGVYGLPSTRDVDVFTEDTPPQPGNDYLKSKWQQEFLIMELGRTKGLPYTIIRPTTVYGPRGGYGSRKLFMEMQTQPVIAIPKNINGHIPFSHVKDVVGAALHLAQSPKAKNEVFNVNDDTDMTNIEFMENLAKLFGKPFMPLPPIPLKQMMPVVKPLLEVMRTVARDVFNTSPPLEPAMFEYFPEDFRYSNDKLKNTGYQFAYPDARLAMEETLNWYLTHDVKSVPVY